MPSMPKVKLSGLRDWDGSHPGAEVVVSLAEHAAVPSSKDIEAFTEMSGIVNGQDAASGVLLEDAISTDFRFREDVRNRITTAQRVSDEMTRQGRPAHTLVKFADTGIELTRDEADQVASDPDTSEFFRGTFITSHTRVSSSVSRLGQALSLPVISDDALDKATDGIFKDNKATATGNAAMSDVISGTDTLGAIVKQGLDPNASLDQKAEALKASYWRIVSARAGVLVDDAFAIELNSIASELSTLRRNAISGLGLNDYEDKIDALCDRIDNAAKPCSDRKKSFGDTVKRIRTSSDKQKTPNPSAGKKILGWLAARTAFRKMDQDGSERPVYTKTAIALMTFQALQMTPWVDYGPAEAAYDGLNLTIGTAWRALSGGSEVADGIGEDDQPTTTTTGPNGDQPTSSIVGATSIPGDAVVVELNEEDCMAYIEIGQTGVVGCKAYDLE